MSPFLFATSQQNWNRHHQYTSWKFILTHESKEDPLLTSPVKKKIKVDDASKVGPEHCTNKITSTTPEKKKKKKMKMRKSKPRLIPIDNYTEMMTNGNVNQKGDASEIEMILYAAATSSKLLIANYHYCQPIIFVFDGLYIQPIIRF
jgi:hypothetical protein